MRIDRNAAAIVGDRQEPIGLHLDLDEAGVASQRLIHRVVDHFREQMMQRLLVGAADIHAGPAPNRLEAFQHLDVAGGITGLAAGRARRGFRCGAALGFGGEKVNVFGFCSGFQWFRHIFSYIAARPAPRIDGTDYAMDRL